MFVYVKLDDGCYGLLAKITSDSVETGERAACKNLLKKRIVKLNKLESASNTKIQKYVTAAISKYYRKTTL